MVRDFPVYPICIGNSQSFYTVISSFSIKSVDGKVIFHGSMEIVFSKSIV
jgi:hypothetical protein